MDARTNNVARDQVDREIVITRLIDAPRDLVFEAWTDAKHLAAWWGPTGFTTTTSAFDMRPGGVWRFVMHGPDGRDYQNRITYDEIVRPERIVYSHGGGDDAEPVQFETTVTLEDIGGKTKLLGDPDREKASRVMRAMLQMKKIDIAKLEQAAEG